MVDSTEYNYRCTLRNWFLFCDYWNLSTLDHRPTTIHDYICFLRHELQKTVGVADKSLTSLSHWFLVNGVCWSRKGDELIAKMMTGYAKILPVKSRPKKPICIELVSRFVQFCNLSTYTGTLQWVMMLTAYWFALRAGEYSCGSKYTAHHIVKAKHLVFDFNVDRSDVVQATLNLRGHKGDPRAQRDAHVPVRCTCTINGREVDHVHCPVHALLRFCADRKRASATTMPSSSPS